LGDKKIFRINVIGNIVDRYEGGREGDEGRKYIFLTLDDGSGQIRLKVFGDDYEKFKDIVQGQTVIVIGVLRNWNNETYVSPEIIREMDPKYLLLRKLETEKDKILNAKPMEKTQIVAIKDKILELIKNSEENGGIEIDEISQKFREIPEAIINQEIQKLLEEGIAFEPRPGKIRWLG
jgi:RPA family protein